MGTPGLSPPSWSGLLGALWVPMGPSLSPYLDFGPIWDVCMRAVQDHFVISRGLAPDSLLSCDPGDIPGTLRPREGRNHFLEL